MDIDTLTFESVINKVCKILYEENIDVIKRKLHERTIVSDYIRPLLVAEFPDFEVNCEYNREGSGTDPKKDLEGKELLPDILIHRQTTDEFNLAAIEVKGYWNKEPREIDEKKLRRLNKKHPYKFLYRLELEEEKVALTAVSKSG
jgi:hypothetical protein